VLTVANSKKEKPAMPPMASSEKQPPETERATAIIGALNSLVDAPQRENPKSQFPWTYCGPVEPLLALMKACWNSAGLPDDADTLVKFCQSPGNYKRLKLAGLLVSHPKHPQNGPGRPRPDLIKVERAGTEGTYEPPMIDGIRR
jgi:hypothetical protein